MDYHLKPIGKTCAATERLFQPGEVCHSVLIEHEGQLTRLDFSEEGWSGPPEGTIGHWRCVVPDIKNDKPPQLDTESLMRYFEQLSEDASPAQDKFRYVLALLLLQKRRLKLDETRRDGEQEFLQLSGSRGEGPYEVRDQHLSDDEIVGLQAGLNQHLTTEWV